MKEETIRFLVEQYYDVQKLRVEAFNRIVAYVKSHHTVESQMKNASQVKNENQALYASRNETESQKAGASHPTSENQKGSASHDLLANQREHASRNTSEPQSESASQSFVENQCGDAVKPSTIAHKIVALKTKPPKNIADLVWYHNSLYETEKQLARRLNAWSKHHPLRIRFFNRIQGIGPIFSSALIAWLSPISRFSNISKLWKYCGLAPGQKRKRGRKLDYNPHLKTLMWKIAGSFEKQKPEKSYYRRVYQAKKKEYLERADLKRAIEKKVKGARLHVRLMAMRYASKRFLADMWLFWRRLEGLPVTEPYVIAVAGHSGVEEWVPDKPAE